MPGNSWIFWPPAGYETKIGSAVFKPESQTTARWLVFPEDLPPHQRFWCGGLEDAAEMLVER